MKPFADLLMQLALTPGRNDKIAHVVQYFCAQPDPDRGLALAALTGALHLPTAKAGAVRALAEARIDPVLFKLSYDFVGDLAETVALAWPAANAHAPLRLSTCIDQLAAASRDAVPALLTSWLDTDDADVRYALLKLVTGGLRVGLSGRLAKIALADLAVAHGQAISSDEIEEVWHTIAPPYTGLFAWVEGRAAKPDAHGQAVFRPAMLAHPLEDADLNTIDAQTHAAEWKFDGIRVQYVAASSGVKLFSRAGEDISAAFPELLALSADPCVLDGELLIARNGIIAPFADLQKRLNRKTASPKLQRDFPAVIRLYDILFDGTEDLRPLPFIVRRARLENWCAQHTSALAGLSGLIPFTDKTQLAALNASARADGLEGLMIKRLDSPYVAGRPRGLWWKWKRAPQTIDAVLMYAQSGHGRRGGLYSDYTFGVWRDDGTLVVVGKAYSGFTDAELKRVDAFVRANTMHRYGPVREVAPGLVMEVAFDAVQLSARHRSGVALRFPRIARLRWDKPVSEADSLANVRALLVPPAT